MKPINVFVDTSTVNRILDIGISKPEHWRYEEDRLYLSKIIEECVKKSKIKLFVNPSVKREIEATPNLQRKKQLLAISEQLHFTPYNKTIFPFTFPAHYVTEEEKEMLQRLKSYMPKGFEKDTKFFLDALADPEIDVLLTTDYDDLARKKLRDYLANEGVKIKIKIFAPKELYEHLQG